MPPDLDHLLGQVRALTKGFKAGDKESPHAFAELASLLFGLTVGAPNSSPRLAYFEGGDRSLTVLGGMGGPQDPLTLSNGHFLKVTVFLQLVDTEDGRRLKVRDSSYQYQLDPEGHEWVFRYDYERDAQGLHPAAHFHVRGNLLTTALEDGNLLERVHFPTLRVSFEGIIRLLAEQFDVPCATPSELWRPVLSEAESLFSEIAHQPLSGPSG